MQLSKASILDYSFVSLNLLFFCSFNGIIQMLTGVGQMASPLIFVVCILIISVTGISLRSLGYSLVLLFFLQFISYYLIGIGSRLFWELDIYYWVSWKKLIIQFLTSLLVVLAYQQYFYRRLCQDGALHRVLLLLFVPMVLSMLVLVLQPFFGLHSFRDATRGNDRGLGVFSNPNTAATLANMGLVFTIDFLFRYPKRWLWYTLCLVLAIVACVLPMSRTGFIVMGAVLILGTLYFLLKPRVHGRFRLMPSLLFIALPLSAVLYISFNYETIKSEQLTYYQRSRLESIELVLTEGKFDSETSSERSELWAHAFELIPHRPLTGYGMGYFNAIPGWIGVHNTFLVTIGNSGILPFLLLVGLILLTGISGLLKRRTGFLILGLTTVVVLTFMTSHNGYSDKVLNILFLLPVLFAAYDRRSTTKDHVRH